MGPNTGKNYRSCPVSILRPCKHNNNRPAAQPPPVVPVVRTERRAFPPHRHRRPDIGWTPAKPPWPFYRNTVNVKIISVPSKLWLLLWNSNIGVINSALYCLESTTAEAQRRWAEPNRILPRVLHRSYDNTLLLLLTPCSLLSFRFFLHVPSGTLSRRRKLRYLICFSISNIPHAGRGAFATRGKRKW